MCGIAGLVNTPDRHARKETVERMLSRIYYRGPDESGIYHSAKATIGNVRLSIIDLAGGQQPLSDSSGRYWIVFNGEIFNYVELKADLEKKGCRFRTTSDTEVLVQLYAEYGSLCLSMLNGQFAFAIWDKKDEELFIARDRMGIRPVFYHYENGQLSFASEIKSIFENSSVKRAFSYHHLLQQQTYWTTLTPATVFEGINELSPGHYLRWNSRGLEVKQFWQLNYGTEHPVR